MRKRKNIKIKILREARGDVAGTPLAKPDKKREKRPFRYPKSGDDLAVRTEDQEELEEKKKDDNWIQGAEKDIEKRGTEGVCTGKKFGGPSCRKGTKRYNLAKTFRKLAKMRKKKKKKKKE